jgi:hypothetical protein
MMCSRHSSSLLGGLVAAGLLALGAGTAAAALPLQTTAPFTLVVQDEGENCGFPIRWEIAGVQHVQRFFDNEGKLVRIQVHIHESNTLTNLVTGKTLADEPVFNQIVTFHENGAIDTVGTMGLFVNVRGEPGSAVIDVGKVILLVVSPTERQLVFEAGQHPFRAETLLSLRDGLSAFCDVLA